MALRAPPAAVFTKPGGSLLIPDRRDLVFEHICGVNAASTLLNRATLTTPGVEAGAPTYAATSVAITGHDTVATKRLDLGVVIPAAEEVFMVLIATKGGAVSALESIDGSNRTGFTLSTTQIIYRNNNSSGQAALNWPADVGSKAVCMFGWGGWNDFPHLQIGVGGDRLSSSETADAGMVADGTTGGFERSGAGNVWMGRTGGGTGSTNVYYGLGAAGARRREYEERLTIYKRLRAFYGSAVVY
ncbi:MAG: hypothetical protein GC145_14420 [Caulobacter sp.]|nr:hypothetical protein [Caulobacter sp.]